MVEDQGDKAKRFLKGTRTDIKKQLVSLNIKDYNEIYEWAQLVEQELKREQTKIKRRTRLGRQMASSDARRDKRPHPFQETHFTLITSKVLETTEKSVNVKPWVQCHIEMAHAKGVVNNMAQDRAKLIGDVLGVDSRVT